MGWKPKEKQLSPEETVELARKELAPYWSGSAPLLGAVKGIAGRLPSVHPLDLSFGKKAWVLLFADLTTFSGEAMLHYAREWSRRYFPYELGFILFVKPSYKFLSTVNAVEPFLRKNVFNFPVVLDHDGLLFTAFGAAAGLPRVVLLQEQKVSYENSGPKWLEGTEAQIQKFLRLKDGGLPLAPVLIREEGTPDDSGGIELNKHLKSGAIQLTGQWLQDDEGIAATDSGATLKFRSPSPRVSFVARSLGKYGQMARVRIELGNDPVFDLAAGPDLIFGDDGGSELRVLEPRIYHGLIKLPNASREITLRFPDAELVPLALHGVRFSSV